MPPTPTVLLTVTMPAVPLLVPNAAMLVGVVLALHLLFCHQFGVIPASQAPEPSVAAVVEMLHVYAAAEASGVRPASPTIARARREVFECFSTFSTDLNGNNGGPTRTTGGA